MKIRKATEKDVSEISRLIRTTLKKINYKDYPKEVINFLIEKNFPANIRRRLKEREVFCLINNGKILGTINFEGDKIGGLYIKSSEIGKGIGTKLMNFIENYAKKKGLKKVRLYPTKTAYKFYINRGYKFKRKHIWKGEGFRIWNKELEKRL